MVREPEPAPRPPVTQEEIRRMLEKETASVPTPDEDSRCLEMVRRVLHGAWVQPSAAEAAGVTAETTIRLTTGGKVVTRALSRPSGNDLFDETVMRAVEAVSMIPGLTPGFLQRHPDVTVLFELE